MVSCADSPDRGHQESAASAASIEGTVREAGSNKPIAGASVFLVRSLDQLQVRAITDPEGRFALSDLDAGRHVVAVTRDGYVVPNRQSSSGYPFQIKSGERLQNVVLSMIPAGSIAGRVFREDGTPAPRVEIQLLQNFYLLGHPQWSVVGLGGSSRETRISTNDRGEFSAAGVDPGQYVIRFIPRELTIDSRVPGGLSPTPVMYPGVRDVSKATRVEIQAGRETLLKDVRLKNERRAWIRVRVINESGRQLEGFGNWSLKPVNWIGSDYLLVEDRITDSFHEFQPDSAGNYDITATWSSPAGRVTGTARVAFRGADIEVRMPILKPQSKATGRVVLQEAGGEVKPVAGAEVAIGPRISYFARTGPDGAFVIPEVYSGRYQFGYVRGVLPDLFVASVRQGEMDLFKDEMTVEGAEVQLEIVLNPGAAVLEGSIADASGMAVHNALVALVPDPPLRERKDYYGAYRDTRTDQNGMFEIRGITPGTYRAFAWKDAPASAYRNAEFMSPFMRSGTAVTLGLNGKVRVELKALEQ